MGQTAWRTARWAVLALFVAGVLVAHNWYGNRHHFYDLEIYRQAVRWWLDGNDLYKFAKPDDTQGRLGFTYPPFGALVLVPFAVLPSGAAIALYALLTVAATVVTTVWLVAPVARRHGWSLPFVLVFALTVISTLEPIRETYTFGQINMLLIALIMTDLLLLAPRASRWTGVCIGVAAAIKLTPAIFIAYLLLSGRRRAGFTAIGSAAGVTLAAAAVAPRAFWDFWTDALWRGEGLGNAAYTFNQSIYALLARLSAPSDPDRTLWAALVLVTVVFGLWRARRAALAGNARSGSGGLAGQFGSAGDEVAGLTLAGLTGSLASPITWAHHLYWFVPALVVLADVSRPGRRAGYGVLAAAVAVTVGLGVVSWFEQGLPTDPWGRGVLGFLIHNWYLLLSALLLVVLPVRHTRGATSAGRQATDHAAAVR